MRTAVAVVGLVALGGLLMANPAYLPLPLGEPTTAYTHAVQPVDADAAVPDGAEPVDRADLAADARDAFDRARGAPDGGYTVEDPSERAASLSYPVEPTPGDGLLIVDHDGDRYEFLTRTVERDPTAVVLQRVVVQPAAFLVGFLSVVAGVALAVRD